MTTTVQGVSQKRRPLSIHEYSLCFTVKVGPLGYAIVNRDLLNDDNLFTIYFTRYRQLIVF